MEEKVESQVGRRLFSMMIDTLLLIVITFFMFGLVVHPITCSITSYNQLESNYRIDSKEYNDIQDEYGIFYYDENNKRIENKDISEEVKEKFLNDERIISLSAKIIAEQEQILRYFILEALCGITISSLLVFLAVPLCLRKGRTLGKFILKLYVVNYDFHYVRWYSLLLRQVLYTIINVLLGIISFGIVPLVCLLVSILTSKNQTPYDLIAHTYVIDGKIPLEVNVKYYNRQSQNNG